MLVSSRTPYVDGMRRKVMKLFCMALRPAGLLLLRLLAPVLFPMVFGIVLVIFFDTVFGAGFRIVVV